MYTAIFVRQIITLGVLTPLVFGAGLFYGHPAFAGSSCPVGSYDIVSDTDPDRAFTDTQDLVIYVESNGVCKGAIGWNLAQNLNIFTEQKLDEFIYFGNGSWQGFHTRDPSNTVYNFHIKEDTGLLVTWGDFQSGMAVRKSKALRKIRITDGTNCGRSNSDILVALNSGGKEVDFEGLGDWTGLSRLFWSGWVDANGGTNFLYSKTINEPGPKQIIINKADYRNMTDISIAFWAFIDGRDHFDFATFSNWRDSSSISIGGLKKASREFQDFTWNTCDQPCNLNGETCTGDYLR